MASSSSSLPVTIPQTEHDVFVSFRGEDTRYNFTSHLLAALRGKQIKTFIDYQLIKGDEISPSLVAAIEGSDISVVVFSEQYANSRWCADELVKILECKNTYGQIVIPVFYHVHPSHVRNQTGIFGNAFSNLQERFQDKVDKLESWRTALRETANLSGFHVQDNRPESEFIEEIVDNILKRLNDKGGSHDIDHLIGVKSIIMKLESLLSTASTSVYTLGIWGIGGIGKTTIANSIFMRISCHFEGSCFIENVREKEEKIGLDQVKQQLFSTLLEGENEKIDPTKGFSFKRLKRKKVVVVFDDVTRFEQMEHLIGSLNSFGDGSRIIITTRDRQVLNNVNGIYEMKGLLHNDALALFSQHGFGQIHPHVSFEDLSKEIIEYAHGVPLVLKVLGRFLLKRKKEEWESEIKKLKKLPHKDIQKVLKLSYDGLDDYEQDIFLDIVCFYKGWSKRHTIEFLDACGFSAEIVIKVLEEKCLIIISNNRITMHDLMEEMGKEIIRQESIDNPGKRSRLWNHENIYKVLTYDTGTQAIKGISFNMSNVKETHFKMRTFKKMHELRFLEFYGKNKCKVSEYCGPIFFELRHLCWDGYPLESLPLHLHPEYLFSIELRNSKIKTLWDGNQDLCNLKHIDLSFSLQLEKIPDLRNTKNLESLILEGCSSLVEIDPTIELNKLVIIDLSNCERLKSLPPRIHSKSLKYLDLSGCTSLIRFPDISSCNVRWLHLKRLAIQELPSSIECLSRLDILTLSKCSKLKKIPSSIGSLHSLTLLLLSDCFITELPESLGELSSLEKLYIFDCSNLRRLPNALGNLKALWRLEVNRTAVEKVPSSIGFLHSLIFLKLSSCRITELPESLGQLPLLSDLTLSYCERLRSLPKLPDSLQCISAYSCKSLKGLPLDLSIFLQNQDQNREPLTIIDLRNCFKLDRNKLSKIVEKFLQNFQITETKRWEEAEIEERENFPIRSLYGMIYYPGSEIPEWFEFQGMGSSGTLKLPQGWRSNKLLGVVICAIGTVAKDDYSELHCRCKFKTKDGQLCSIDWNVEFPAYADSDHVILNYELGHYIVRKDFYECPYKNKVFIRFEGWDSGCPSKMVKKWGIHFLYRQDHSNDEEDRAGEDEEQSNGDDDEEEEGANEEESCFEAESTDEDEGQTSSDDEEGANEEESSYEVEEPHPKRLKYSTTSF